MKHYDEHRRTGMIGLVTRRIVIVSGAPGAGKSTLALPLSEELGFSLLSKDHIKETLHDSLEAPAGDLASSRRLGAAAMNLIWALAARCPEAILEANFLPRHPATRPHLESLAADVVEVYCWCPPAEAARRYAARAATVHPVHVVHELSAEVLAEYDQPLGYGPVINVDTTQPTDVPDVAARVRQAFREEMTSP
ncbi:AAA family ATPase [Streptomyces sp. NPDC002573]|uniref:AAA family ATPase n=1 Tax=Streptomyces sp. NPDC002573 TaxID=3364651 RepID=UPI0036840BC4